MNILGIHGNFGKAEHDSAAVLVHDNEIIAAAEEERFVRFKHAVGLMPDRAIQYCLNEAGITMKDIDIVAFPRATWKDFRARLEAYLWYNFGHIPQIVFVDHHLAHATSSYLISGFDSALILTLDQSGDGVSCGVFRGIGTQIKLIEAIPFPNSLGLFAAFITQYLGFRSNHDEYKIMGLAAYGNQNIDLRKIITFEGGNIKFNQNLLHAEVMKRHPIFHTDQIPIFKEEKYSFLPPRRLRGTKLLGEHKDLAASAQKAIEDAVFALINKYKRPEDSFLCLAGGVAENSVANGKIASKKLFKDIYVAPACNDAGTALGAALYVANQNGYKFHRMNDNKWGPAYSNKVITKILKSYGIKHRYSENVEEETARILEERKIVGWFQGRMEFGSRALGARSLIADPSDRKMKSKVNRIKKREEFRPFAPSVLIEHVSSIFNLYQRSPFMSFTLDTTKEGKDKIAAATHIDFTGRLQTVEKDGSKFRTLIEHFYKRTKIPAVLNTSLNSGWEPIIESPDQAIAFFFSSEADALILNDYIIGKHGG